MSKEKRKLPNFSIIHEDSLDWMAKQKNNSINCVITSPPYNLGIKYSNYKDNLSREKYLKWIKQVSSEIYRILDDKGHFFLNMGSSNKDPYISMDVCMELRKKFILQNHFIWVKHIAVNDFGYGQYKPISSDRYVSNTTEDIFHFTKDGKIPVDRTAIGQRNLTHPKYPELYSKGRHLAVARRKIAKRLGYKNYIEFKKNVKKNHERKFNEMLEQELSENIYDPLKPKCIGNAWFIPYTPTSKLSKKIGAKSGHNLRKVSRGGHPATYPLQLPLQCLKFSGLKKGSRVYDPFVGTGTTVLASIKLGMEGLGTDIDKNYVNFANHRIKAELQSS